MKLVKKGPVVNEDAIELLEGLLVRIKEGNIASIACCYVSTDGQIGGETSKGDDTLLMWSSMSVMERSFYDAFIGSNDG